MNHVKLPTCSVSKAILKALVEHPGTTALELKKCWPSDPRYRTYAYKFLEILTRTGHVAPRFEPPFWKAGKLRPKKKFYVTDKGFAAHEFITRQRYTENGNTSHSNRKSGTRCRTSSVRRA